MIAGRLRESVRVMQPTSADDGLSTAITGAAEAFATRAHYRRLVGTEAVQAARLAGRQPTVITIRASAAARAIRTGWHILDARTGERFNIRGIVETEDRQFLEILAEGGDVPEAAP